MAHKKATKTVQREIRRANPRPSGAKDGIKSGEVKSKRKKEKAASPRPSGAMDSAAAGWQRVDNEWYTAWEKAKWAVGTTLRRGWPPPPAPAPSICRLQKERLGALATVLADKVTTGVDRVGTTDALKERPTALWMCVDVSRRGRVGGTNLLLGELVLLALKAVHGTNV